MSEGCKPLEEDGEQQTFLRDVVPVLYWDLGDMSKPTRNDQPSLSARALDFQY